MIDIIHVCSLIVDALGDALGIVLRSIGRLVRDLGPCLGVSARQPSGLLALKKL